MSRVLYFAYGSNLDAEQLAARCPSARGLHRASLADHRLDFTHFSRRWRGGAADVVAERGARVWGALYALELDDLTRLDAFEGGYDRLVLSVATDSAPRVEVTTYTVRSKGLHAPSREYLDKMLRWGSHWELPSAYLRSLRGVRAAAGDESAR